MTLKQKVEKTKLRPPRIYKTAGGKFYIIRQNQRVYIPIPLKTRAHMPKNIMKQIVNVVLTHPKYMVRIKRRKRTFSKKGQVYFNKPIVEGMIASKFGFANTNKNLIQKKLILYKYEPHELPKFSPEITDEATKRERLKLLENLIFTKALEDSKAINSLSRSNEVAIENNVIPTAVAVDTIKAPYSVENPNTPKPKEKNRRGKPKRIQGDLNVAYTTTYQKAIKDYYKEFKKLPSEEDVQKIFNIRNARDNQIRTVFSEKYKREIAKFAEQQRLDIERDQEKKNSVEKVIGTVAEPVESVPAPPMSPKPKQLSLSSSFIKLFKRQPIKPVSETKNESLENVPSEEEGTPRSELTDITSEEEGEKEGSGRYSNWRKGLYDSEIHKIMDSKCRRFVPVIMSDEIPKLLPYVNNKTREFGFIINTTSSKTSGQHWRAVFIDVPNCSINYYDSLVSTPDKKFLTDIKMLVDRINPPCYMKLKINMIKQQSDDTNNCGFFAMKFLIDMFKNKKFKEACMVDKSDAGEYEIEKFKNYL